MIQINIIGEKDCGKTTLICGLITELTKRGLKIGTVKHTSHDHEFDKPGTDSWQHQKAGSAATMIISPEKLVLHLSKKSNRNVDNWINFAFKDFDLLLWEGFHDTSNDIIEILSYDNCPKSFEKGKLRALISNETADFKLPVFKRNNILALSDWIIDTYFSSKYHYDR